MAFFGTELLNKAHYQQYEYKKLEAFFRMYTGKSVLDVGCGHGRYLSLLKKAGCTATGVDVNPLQVEALCNEGFSVFTPDALPVQKQHYDLIVMAHVIEHMDAPALVTFMDTYLDMLKDDGTLLILTPLAGERFFYDPTHVRPYYPQSLRMLFGGLHTPSSMCARHRIVLKDIYFFCDSWRVRRCRSFYPVQGLKIFNVITHAVNLVLAGLHIASGGKLGTQASWLGLYSKLPASPCQEAS